MAQEGKILSNISHRPWPLPHGHWKYYQEWNDALFLHWEVPYASLRKLVPIGIDLDLFDGKCYVSLVAFTMQKIRPRYLPSVSLVSDFHEINVRTYVSVNNKPGVYFLNIEAAKCLSAYIAKVLSGLPYEKSHMVKGNDQFHNLNKNKNFHLNVDFTIGSTMTNKLPLDVWLTERYCLYHVAFGNIFRYEIHHHEWEVKRVNINHLDLKYNLGNVILNKEDVVLSHYSSGVKVLAWGKEQLCKQG
jgi:uncharacterized protein